MNISDAGIALIKSFEAYMKKLPDGGCRAYREVLGKDKSGKPILDIPTCGWGCTEGVTMDTIWTREEADVAFKKEIAKHEAIVTRLVTAEISQGMYDALVSFNYNCGKLKGSTLLKLVNAGNPMAAAAEFSRFTFAKGVQLKGLVRRRAAEKALFLSDVDQDEPEHCPQQADTPKKDRTTEIIAAGTAVIAGGGTHVANQAAAPPAPKMEPKRVIEKAQETRAQVEQATDIGKWVKTSLSGDGSLIFIVLILAGAALFGYETFVRRRA